MTSTFSFTAHQQNTSGSRGLQGHQLGGTGRAICAAAFRARHFQRNLARWRIVGRLGNERGWTVSRLRVGDVALSSATNQCGQSEIRGDSRFRRVAQRAGIMARDAVDS